MTVLDKALSFFGAKNKINVVFNFSKSNYLFSLEKKDNEILNSTFINRQELVNKFTFQIVSHVIDKTKELETNKENKTDIEDENETKLLFNILKDKNLFKNDDLLIDKKLELVELSNEKNNFVKALLFYLRNQAKANTAEENLNYVLLLSTDELNTVMTEISNIEHVKNNYLYNFKELSLTLMTISKTKEIKFEFINLY